jgi:hypothetical protein
VRRCKDDVGAIQIVEALLAGTLILTAILFVTATTAPSPSTSETGIDLAGTASRTLSLLQDQDSKANLAGGPTGTAPSYASWLEEVASLALGTLSTDSADYASRNAEAASYIESVLGPRLRYQLRLDNGIAPLQLLPADTSFRSEPRAAKAAEVFISPPWQANVGCLLVTATYAPGDIAPALSPLDALTAPNGATVGPGGDTWSVWWDANDENNNGDTIIPYQVPYGLWDLNNDGTSCIRIALADGTSTDYPAYGVQLVVWPIAG